MVVYFLLRVSWCALRVVRYLGVCCGLNVACCVLFTYVCCVLNRVACCSVSFVAVSGLCFDVCYVLLVVCNVVWSLLFAV